MSNEPDVAPTIPPPVSAPPFARRCIEACGDAWEASFAHPFVRDLIDGSLSPDRFRFYQMQDARYLEAFADACSIISTRSIDPKDKLWFIDGARLAILVEQQLHADYGRKLGYSADDIAGLELTPNNRAYQDHMLRAAHQGSLLEAVAALSPCPWLYTDAGRRIMLDMDGEIPPDHPYADWIATYADPGFVTYTEDLLGFMERESEARDETTRNRALEAFRTSVRYEWMFWDQAYRHQSWPV